MFVFEEEISIEEFLMMKGCSSTTASVAAKYALGYSAKEVGDMFSVNFKSVYRHFNKAAKKLSGVRSQFMLMRYFLKLYAQTGREGAFFKLLAPSFVELARKKPLTKSKQRAARRTEVIKSLAETGDTFLSPGVVTVDPEALRRAEVEMIRVRTKMPNDRRDLRLSWVDKILDEYTLVEFNKVQNKNKAGNSWRWF